MGKKKGRAIQKNPQAQPDQEDGNLKKAPHTFIFQRGHVGKNIGQLVLDMRRLMSPYTASKLRVRKKNVLKDFVSVAGLLNVSHFVMFTKTEGGTNMRLLRLPRGPTMTFAVKGYSLSKDVINSLKRHNMEQKQFQHHPLLVMNNFSGDGMHIKLMTTMFQNLFPSINVNKVKLNQIRRCVLLNYNQEDESLDLRHYNVRAVPVGMSRGVKKLIKAKVPSMAKYDDISEYLMKGGDISESEAELDGPHNEVVVPQELSGRGNIKSAKSALRLTEIGPRITLQLVKIEEGICDGEVLYHKYIQKTDKDVESTQKLRAKKKKLREQKKAQQAENVKKKQDEKEALKQKSLEGMKKKSEKETPVEDDSEDSVSAKEIEPDDDIEYYRQEVGEEPDPELFPSAQAKRNRFNMKRKSSSHSASPFKKKRENQPEGKTKDASERKKERKTANKEFQELLKKRKIKKLKNKGGGKGQKGKPKRKTNPKRR